MFAAERCARIPLPRKLISTRKLDYTLATTRSQSSLIKSDQNNNWQNQGGNQYWMLSKEGEIRRDEACFDYSGKEVLSFFCDFFANIILTPIYTLFFREKFLLTKRCRFHCSWKLVALSLTVLTLILSSVIAYFGGKIFICTLQKCICISPNLLL